MTDDQNQALLHADENNDEVNNNGDNNDGQNNDRKTDPRDALTPDHPRFQEVYKELQETKKKADLVDQLQDQITALRAQVGTQQDKHDDDAFTDEEIRALDRIERGIKERGYVKKEDLAEADRIRGRAQQITDLEKEYSGKNGYPKFEVTDVTEYAKKNGFGDNLRAAYRDMHFNAIIKVEAKRGGSDDINVESEHPGGGDRAIPGEFTREQIANMSPEEWKKNEASIMAKFRKATIGR